MKNNTITDNAKANFDKNNRSCTRLSFVRCRIDKGYGAILFQVYNGKHRRNEILKGIFGNDDPRTKISGYYSMGFKRLEDAGLVKHIKREYWITDLGNDLIKQVI